jgi:hypothetical protein
VTLRPAIVAVVEREEEAVFAATFNVTVPLPDPLAPLAMLIQELCSDADQAHPAVAVTLNEAGPPARATDREVGETE